MGKGKGSWGGRENKGNGNGEEKETGVHTEEGSRMGLTDETSGQRKKEKGK
jgi:hypothetical protein